MGSVGSMVFGAAIGGTAEALGGGKFANGAVTGAYIGLFNHALHQGQIGVGNDRILEYYNEAEAYSSMEKIQKDSGNEVPGFHLRKYHSNGSFDELWIIDLDGQISEGRCIWRGAALQKYFEDGYQLEGLTHTHPDNTYASNTDMHALRDWANDNGGNLNLDVITNGNVYRYYQRATDQRTFPNGSFEYDYKAINKNQSGTYDPDYIFNLINSIGIFINVKNHAV